MPLVVGLHTWSHDRFNQLDNYLPLCKERGWALLLPEFRGPNLRGNPNRDLACGSAAARQDIVDAVNFVAEHEAVDPRKLFLLGASGGGHMALLTAAFTPGLWRAVEAWCPITDLREWHAFYGPGNRYAAELEYCLGGEPGCSPEVEAEYRSRSPVNFLKELAKVNLSVHHGRHDKIVPYRITYRFAALLEEVGPERFYFDFFDGRHEADNLRSFAWFEKQLSHVRRASVTG